MKNVSTAFKNELYKGNRNYIKSARITLSDETILELDNRNFWNNGMAIDNAVSSDGSFDIGAAIIGQLTLVINNIEEEFSDYDFSDAKIDNVKVGLKLPDDAIESLSYGVYTVNDTNYNGSIITLTAYDNMYKFDKPYTKSSLLYPATLNEIVRDACSVCDVILQSVTFDNDDFVVENRPEDEAITFRNIIQWSAQISGNYATIDESGKLVLSWYNTQTLEETDILDGGEFEPWKNENIVSGGTFSSWTSENVIDGGTFQSARGYHHLYGWNTLNVSTDDVVITGVKVTEEIDGEEGKETVSFQSGVDGYVLEISGNKLIQGTAQKVAEYLGLRLNGLRFRPFSGSMLSNPSIEPGDVAVLSDRKSNAYNTLITSYKFQPGVFQSVSCEAKTPIRNSANRFSEATQAYVDARKQIEKEKTDREKAIEDLQNKLNNSSGTFTTIEKQPDGSNIYYLHNKPLLSDSDIVWKMTAEAWAVSTDGGKTWNGGMTVDGDTIVRILSAVGVNADWINAGTLSADFIKGGVLVLGGKDNINGKISMFDSSNKEMGIWSNQGILLIGGSSVNPALRITDANKLYGLYCSYDFLSFSNAQKVLLQMVGERISVNARIESLDDIKCSFLDCDDLRVNLDAELSNITSTIGDITSLDCRWIDASESIRSKNFYVDQGGSKAKISKTKNFGERIEHCYETASPYFGDIGQGVLDENGECRVYIDSIFSETINTDCEYQVFLQKEGEGDIWVCEKNMDYFFVKGTKNLSFAWEIKGIQKGIESKRLDIFDIDSKKIEDILYGKNGANYYEEAQKETYSEQGYDFYQNYINSLRSDYYV